MLLMKKAQPPVILMMMPVKVRVTTRVISRANLPVEAGRGVLHNHSAQMQNGKKSPAEIITTMARLQPMVWSPSGNLLMMSL